MRRGRPARLGRPAGLGWLAGLSLSVGPTGRGGGGKRPSGKNRLGHSERGEELHFLFISSIFQMHFSNPFEAI